MNEFEKTLSQLKVSSPFNFSLKETPKFRLNLTETADPPLDFDPADNNAFQNYIQARLEENNAEIAWGGYRENRLIYLMSDIFKKDPEEPRTLHLGVDVWFKANTPVHAVLPGKIHSMANNHAFGDYGPTIILEHNLLDQEFYTLYGHLNKASLLLCQEGEMVVAGSQIGWLGEPEENVGWPPHLHFQIIKDLGGRKGDFPGVCKPSEEIYWTSNCPDPNLLLGL